MKNNNLTELLEKEIGISIEKAKIYCPLCYANKLKQPMITTGDFENNLFCPHCELTFEIKIDTWSHRHYNEAIKNWYSKISCKKKT